MGPTGAGPHIRQRGDHDRGDHNRSDSCCELHPATPVCFARRERIANEPRACLGNVPQLRLLFGERFTNFGSKLIHLNVLLDKSRAKAVAGAIDATLGSRG
jgi:hypothetical protein